MNELLTQEQVNLIAEVKNFCDTETIVSVTVQNDAQFENAGELGKALRSYERKLEKERKIAKEPYLQKGKLIDVTFNEPKNIVIDRLNHIAKAIREYQDKIRMKQIEEQRKRDEEARIAREKLEEQARKLREKNERLQREAEEAKQRALEAENEADRKRALAEAERKEKQAESAEAKAEMKQEVASVIVAPIVEESNVKLKGVSARKTWKARVTDKVKFIEWCLRTENLEYIEINQANLNSWAKRVKDTKSVQGVKFYSESSTVFRA